MIKLLYQISLKKGLNMNLIKPKSLKPGDTITIIAPSGNIDAEKISNGKKYFEARGYKVKLAKNINNKNAYCAGTDEERLEDLHSAFSDSETSAIICARGGYGALRLIDKIDYTLIRNNPKIFCGYSDITVLNTMLLKNSGLITFSGAMVQSDFGQDDVNNFTENEFFGALENKKTEIHAADYKNYTAKTEAKGILLGGNLSTFASLCGTDFLPDEKFIFFAEDVNEPVYKIDRYITQLLNTRGFKDMLSAIVLGDFMGIEEEYQKDFDNLFKSIGETLNIPVVKTFPFSHTKHKTTVPVGAGAVLTGSEIIISDYMI